MKSVWKLGFSVDFSFLFRIIEMQITFLKISVSQIFWYSFDRHDIKFFNFLMYVIPIWILFGSAGNRLYGNKLHGMYMPLYMKRVGVTFCYDNLHPYRRHCNIKAVDYRPIILFQLSKLRNTLASITFITIKLCSNIYLNVLNLFPKINFIYRRIQSKSLYFF